ncbi:MAG: GntR family transcriptional regulator [Bacillota bacterium]|nr:GntR family transcriptional regulator [Bacillota bacterium]
MDQYAVNTSSNIPIYQQIADAIYADIKSGRLAPGTKIMTVRELADSMQIACGTVKRAYDELKKIGAIEMTQGRGSYVCYRREDSDSRKERAMAAIDKMLNQLDELGFSPAEVNIFIELKLRERAQRESAVRVALIECSPEILMQLTEHLRHLGKINISRHILEDVLNYPYKIGEEADLIVTSAVHAPALQNAIPEKDKITKVVLEIVPRSVLKIALLKPGSRVGILTGSHRFGELLQEVCKKYTENITLLPPQFFDGQSDCGRYLSDKDAVLVPEGYEKFCPEQDARLLKEFDDGHDVILCEYQIDQGSMMYLEERIMELQKKKSYRGSAGKIE